MLMPLGISGRTIGMVTANEPSAPVTALPLHSSVSSMPGRAFDDAEKPGAGRHQSDRRRLTVYFTCAPCTGTPAKLRALALTTSVSPAAYFSFIFGNSTLKVGRLYSSTRMRADELFTKTVKLPLREPTGSTKSAAQVP